MIIMTIPFNSRRTICKCKLWLFC